jgi:HK97 family phage major capsid protein
MDIVIKAIEGVEAKLVEMSKKAEAEFAAMGKVSEDTKTAIDTIGIEQRTLAERLLKVEQRASAQAEGKAGNKTSWGAQFTAAEAFKSFAGGHTQKARVEVKNTIVGSSATVFSDRQPGIVSGLAQPLSLEAFLPSLPTTSNAIDFVRESAFTNTAVEVAEGAAKPESAITFVLVSQPVSTVAHWLKISRQLAADNAALTAYVDSRLTYGVNLRVEQQLVNGTGVSPNINGFMATGNFTAHGYTNTTLTAAATILKKLVLIRKMIADCWVAGAPADAIVLNPADWAQIEIELITTAAGQTLYSVTESGQPRLFGLPVIQSIGMTAGNVAVGAFAMAVTKYDREGVVVEMSDSDVDNFTKNLITIRAERRLALAIERPAAIRAGLLTPP